jgi:hypothetical protein
MAEIEGKNGGTLTPFQPGQSGNPSGISKEMKAMHMRAAEIAARLRLAEMEAQLQALEAGKLPGINSDNSRLWKDAEDRALGAPKNTTEHEGKLSVGRIECLFLDATDPSA